MQAQFKSGTNSRLKNSHQIQANAHFNFEAEFCRALVSLCITVLCCAFLALCYVLFNLMPVSFDDLGLEIQQNLFGKNKMFQRGDFGGRIGIGLSIHSVYIGASYGGGFLNIAQEDDTSKFRNRSWSLSVGYDF